MIRCTTVGALLLALLTLAAPPAVAKGPVEVEVHNLQTGATTLLTFRQREMLALGELVGSPTGEREPPGVRSGALKPVATLSWQNDDQTPFWFDRIYADETGWRTWVQRREDLSGSGAVSWARVRAGHAFHVVLSAVVEPGQVTTASLEAPAERTSRKPEGEGSARFDAASFGWGAGLAGLLVASVFLVARRRRSLSAR